jgi:hypothetical protein
MVDKEKRRIDVPDLIRKDFETRKIVVVLGIDFHEADILYDMEIIKNNPRKYPMKKYSSYRPPLAFLRQTFSRWIYKRSKGRTIHQRQTKSSFHYPGECK